MTKNSLKVLSIAIGVAILGSLEPTRSVLELYRLPTGSPLRPMHIGVELLIFGLGTPFLVGSLVLFAFQPDGRASRASPLAKYVSILAIVLSSIPLCLLIVGVRLAVHARELYYKP